MKSCLVLLLIGSVVGEKCDVGDGECLSRSSIMQVSRRQAVMARVTSEAKMNTESLMSMSDQIKEQIGEKSYAQITPEVRTAINEMLSLCDTIASAIQKDFDDTQAQIDTDIESLRLRAGEVKTDYGVADGRDTGLDSCRATEKTNLQAWETCIEQLAACEKEKCAKCPLTEKQHFKYELSIEDKEYTCNFDYTNKDDYNATDHCHSFGNLVRDFNRIEDDWWTHKNDFDFAFQECETQTTSCQKLKEDCDAKWTTFHTQKLKCDSDCQETRKSICKFGDKYQEKCVAQHKYETLMQDVQKSGGDTLSEVDRQAEWAALQQIKCMLQAYVDGGEFDNTNIDNGSCGIAYNANRKTGGVGTLNVHKQDQQKYSSGEYYNCGETNMEFSGFKWVTADTSGAYTRTQKSFVFAEVTGGDLVAWEIEAGFPRECTFPNPAEDLCPLNSPQNPPACPGEPTTTLAQWEAWAAARIIPGHADHPNVPLPHECTCTVKTSWTSGR